MKKRRKIKVWTYKNKNKNEKNTIYTNRKHKYKNVNSLKKYILLNFKFKIQERLLKNNYVKKII